MRHTNSNSKPFWQNSLILILLFSVIGIVTGYFGFLKIKYDCGNSLYTTIQLFVLHHPFDKPIDWLLQMSRWSIFIVIILLSRDALSVLFREQIKFLTIKLRYRNHIIICGLTEQSLQFANKLFDKNPKERIIFIDNIPDNPFYHSLRHPRVKLIIGFPTSRTILRLANVHEAKEIFIFTDSDTQNVENTKIIFDLIKRKHRINGILECYTLIQNNEFANLLEEATLFKYPTKYFDGHLFNLNETGIKHFLIANTNKVFQGRTENIQNILLVGLTNNTEIVLRHLAHCTTIKGENFKFTIIEKDRKTIDDFKKEYWYLKDFATIEYVDEISVLSQDYASVFVCYEQPLKAIEAAYSVHYHFAKENLNIFVFYDESNKMSQILNEKWKDEAEKQENYTLKERNIHLINLMEEYFAFFNLDKKITTYAEKANEEYNKLCQQQPNNKSKSNEYNDLSEHFKQSNRNQCLDNYFKFFIATGDNFDFEYKGEPVVFNETDKQNLAIMEHRRWMLEKYANGWKYGKERNNKFKLNPYIIDWHKIDKKTQGYDYIPINMIEIITKQEPL